jgi:sigma-E factor negative regulatory protein RseB
VNLRTSTLLLVVGVIGVLGASSAGAAPLRAPFIGDGRDDQRAVDLLRRSAAAMSSTSYSGTRVLSAWGRDSSTTVLVDVEHVAGQGTRLSLRGGGIAHDTATFLAAGEDGRGHTLGVQMFDLLTESYAVSLGPADSVAGRSSRVVEVSRGASLAARLWIDDRSGLLLRREVFDHAGRLARENTFVDVDVEDGAARFMAHLPPVPPGSDEKSVAVGRRPALEAEGWDCPGQAGAMRLVGIESMERTGAVHMIYSDGLTRMSVFEQRGSLDPDSVRGFETLRLGDQVVYVREGLPTYAMWQEDGLVFTVVTDGPLGTVAGVVASEPVTRASAPDFWERVAGGMARLGEWATPLV